MVRNSECYLKEMKLLGNYLKTYFGLYIHHLLIDLLNNKLTT